MVIFALGAHVIKCGLSLFIIDLIKRGVISAVALNGAGVIHDFEMALIGETSEDVVDGLPTGRFGMAEETATYINAAIRNGAAHDCGLGEAVGQTIIAMNLPFREYSILAHAVDTGIPVTAHIAIGASYEECYVDDPASPEGSAKIAAMKKEGVVNVSAQHVDIVIDFRPGGCGRRVLLDDKEIIVQDGVWVIP